MGSGASQNAAKKKAERLNHIRGVLGSRIPGDVKSRIEGDCSMSKKEQIAACFKDWDLDHNGKINKYELIRGCKNLGVKVELDDIRELFASADGDSDGEIDCEEFVKWLDEKSSLDSSKMHLGSVPVRSPAPKTEKVSPPHSGISRRGPLLVFLHSAAELPASRTSAECSADVVAFVCKGDNDVGPKAHWPSCKNNNNPCWNTARDLGCHATGSEANGKLHLQVWSQEVGVLREYRSQIGEVCLSLEEIQPDIWYDVPIKPSQDKPSLRFKIMSQPPLVKKVFLVRHAESEWNRAQRKKQVSAMLEQVDHPLSGEGLQQCFRLEQKIKDVQEAAGAPSYNEAQFLAAQLTLSSPLTRAIETALIGLHPILARLKSLRLCANAREKRNLGGRDTTGTAKGEAEILHRLNTVLASHGQKEADIDRYLSVRLDTAEADNRWWNDSRESASAVQERLAEFLRQMLYLREERIIVVGHSHFFRDLIKQGLSLSATIVGVEENEVFSKKQDLFHKKLMNCGVLAATLDFRKGADRPISEVELLFKTELE